VWTVTEVLLAILGIASLVTGVFILVGDETQWVGFGGDLSWQVGEIPPEVGYGLAIGGGVLLVVALALVLAGRRSAARAEARERPLRDLVVHATVFLLVNAFLWAQDIVAGGGLEYAYWTTIPWVVGLAAHALATYLGRGQPGEQPPAQG
jgi:hypothetical protein